MSNTGKEIWDRTTTCPAQTASVGQVVAMQAKAGDLITLSGQLGAGKTQFVRGLAKGLGLDSTYVTSPTFVISQAYDLPQTPADESAIRQLIHIDAYRLEHLEDLESIGWEIHGDQLGGEMRKNAVVAIEWADQLDGLAGVDRLDILLGHESETHRHIQITAFGSWLTRIQPLKEQLDAELPSA